MLHQSKPRVVTHRTRKQWTKHQNLKSMIRLEQDAELGHEWQIFITVEWQSNGATVLEGSERSADTQSYWTLLMWH